jgi:tetratricopeptide (TPR) repeat protein
VLAGRGTRDEAITELNEATRLAPQDAVAHRELGKVLFDQGKDEEAITAFGKAIRLDRGDADAHYGLGRALCRRGRRQEAIAAYGDAIRLDSRNVDAHLALARELLASPKDSRRENEEALTHARKAAELRSDSLTLSTLALAAYRAGHWDEAIVATGRSTKNSGGSTQDRFLLAMAHRAKGDKYEAGKWFDIAVARARQRDRDDPEVLRLWSEAAELLGRPGPIGAGADPRKSAAPGKAR